MSDQKPLYSSFASVFLFLWIFRTRTENGESLESKWTTSNSTCADEGRPLSAAWTGFILGKIGVFTSEGKFLKEEGLVDSSVWVFLGCWRVAVEAAPLILWQLLEEGTFLSVSMHLLVFLPKWHSAGLFSDNQNCHFKRIPIPERERESSIVVPCPHAWLLWQEINDFGDWHSSTREKGNCQFLLIRALRCDVPLPPVKRLCHQAAPGPDLRLWVTQEAKHRSFPCPRVCWIAFSHDDEPSLSTWTRVLRDSSHLLTHKKLCTLCVHYYLEWVTAGEIGQEVKSKASGWRQDEKCPNEKFIGLGGRRPECQTVPGTLQMFNSNKIRSTKKA